MASSRLARAAIDFLLLGGHVRRHAYQSAVNAMEVQSTRHGRAAPDLPVPAADVTILSAPTPVNDSVEPYGH